MIAREPNYEDQKNRFVILEHDHPFLHWDLLMQKGDALKAWRLLEAVQVGAWLSSESIPDHRLKYLDYEGPVSGDRGTVTRIAAGRFSESESRISTRREFKLFDCELATSAVCRLDDATKPQWYFE